jgi:peroxiredoxin Q/BCP
VPLLADTAHAVAEAYGVWGPGVKRQTFVVGADGNLERHYEKVAPAEHAAQILADLG